MKDYLPYVAQLEALAEEILSGRNKPISAEDLEIMLNGEAGRELRSRTSLKMLQESGAFFTGHVLRDFALDTLPLNNQVIYWDPTCGAGDLLIGAAKLLPVSDSLESTLIDWSTKLCGNDIHEEFVRAAKARLVICAYARGVRPIDTGLKLSDIFGGIQKLDSLNEHGTGYEQSVVLLNPPYHKVQLPGKCDWASGHVTAASLFIEHAIKKSESGTRIIAILPDVLRSGTRYEKWRQLVYRSCYVDRVALWGVFDTATDVDVFVLDMTIREEETTTDAEDHIWQLQEVPPLTIGDFCEVSVGAVVPHRHEDSGPMIPYLAVHNSPPWEDLLEVEQRIRFDGTKVKAPFIALRRTSNPKDRNRLVVTTVLGDQEIAVENHLIVIKPKQHTVEACRQIAQILRLPASATWLNQRIRCRHLTVSAIRELPWL